MKTVPAIHTESTPGKCGSRDPISDGHVKDLERMRSAARQFAAKLIWLPELHSSDVFAKRSRILVTQLEVVLKTAEAALAGTSESEDLLWLRDNSQQLSSSARLVASELAPLIHLPLVSLNDEIVPRVLAIAKAFFNETADTFRDTEFAAFCLAFEETSALEFREIGALVPALKLVLLEQIAVRGAELVQDPVSQSGRRITTCIRAFRSVTQASWMDLLETLVPFDRVLSQDPVRTYASMDVESRNVYREAVARIARRSDKSELQVAETALALAQQAYRQEYSDERVRLRESHIGHYLVGDGITLLCQRVGFHPNFSERLQAFVRRHPDECLLFGIATLTFTIITGAVWFLTSVTTPLVATVLSMAFLLLPGSQAAVQLMNYLITNLLPATSLPKLDLSKGIPDDCVTLVAVPTLLLNETQVRSLVEKLEVRFLGNHDRNICFALLSDLPDAPRAAPEDSALVVLCSKLIQDLNARYSTWNEGSFFLLHRHRVYNPREKRWMGWERKRGKLHDLNQFLRARYDRFPVKVGDLSVLPKVRFVITLDSDTELPRGSALRMVGALAHPLNQAIVDPVNNIVVEGYGILQPRVGVSVQCTSRSRLAALFAGETGLDPYTRAVSDAYQDLYGEGTFAGKGIYEVDTVLRVLDHRFPRNNLLSHDLIEGAYARAGLATDVIVIEDYPSHYSAYNRRKHRWLRGDWQIVQWLTDRVPDESGALVPNPISLVSRWKILDNLRRSLVEPATFALLLFGWFATGHPVKWTIATIFILFVPAWVEFAFGIVRAVFGRRLQASRDSLRVLVDAIFTVLLSLTLLAHQALLSLDAVLRALVRSVVTRERLLEWETAAEAEIGDRQNSFDRYLDWVPLLAVTLGLTIWLTRPRSMLVAIPILVLWAFSTRLAVWLNTCPIELPPELTHRDSLFLRRSALHIWRYFAEFSSPEHHWLVPDNVQDKPRKMNPSVSPTNVGLLLNARQVANELGYLTVPELAALTEKTLDTIAHLPKYRGHLLNWYDTRTLEPKRPLFISSVDSGNLVASLWTLEQGCLDRLRRPLLSRHLADGLLDHLRILAGLRVLKKSSLARCEAALQSDGWLAFVLAFPEGILDDERGQAKDAEASADVSWFREQARLRVKRIREMALAYMPWRLPELAPLCTELVGSRAFNDDVPLQQLPDLLSELLTRPDRALRSVRNGDGFNGDRLSTELHEARRNATRLIERLHSNADQARSLANTIDFEFLLDKKRQLMSVGFDAQTEELLPYSYDLLATEPRTAIFVAIAKEDIPQESWFRLSRPYMSENGRFVLLSWTGTMFEYLMPSIWMRSYPNTLLDRAVVAAVRTQQAYATHRGVPWGISESACSRRNDAGDYHYEAFGVPSLALKGNGPDVLVVSPYSTFLALSVDRKAALSNLHRMDDLGWFGRYGFYEAADYSANRRFLGPKFELATAWMAHHQGMSLLALGNFLRDNVVQRWFHADRRVQATELLLQEKPVHVNAA